MKPIYILIPLISALTGWLANWLLIKMLFHPIRPVKIFGLTIQGILPRRQPEMARQLGRLVSKELFSFGDIKERITHPDNIQKLLPQVETHIDEFLRTRLKEAFPVISMFVGDKTISQLKAVFMAELESLFPVVMTNYVNNLEKDLDLEQLVTEKLASYSTEKMESGLYRVMSKELRWTGVAGAVTGLLLGLLQVLLIIVLGG